MVSRIVSRGLRATAFVYYTSERGWQTYLLMNIDINDEKVVLTDHQCVYTLKGDQ